VCRIAVVHGRFGIAWIGTYDPGNEDVTPVASAGLEASDVLVHEKAVMREDTPRRRGTIAIAIRERRPSYNNDIASDAEAGGKRRQEALRRGYRSSIVLPLTVDGAVFGIMSRFATEPGFFDEEEVGLLTEVAGNISFAVEHMTRQEKVEYLSYYDTLTGLPNRALFLDRAGQQLRARGGETPLVAVILINLERFRNINETFGRNGGDDLLRLVARRLEEAFRGKDYISRVAADGYGVVIRGVRDAAAVAHAVENQIMACFREPFVLDRGELRVAAKAGIALYPADGADADTLFRNAEAALQDARRSNERYLFYAADMNARAAQALSLETRLRNAVDAEQFVLHYQPKIKLSSGAICGLEALIRWQEPGGGLVPPGNFIPVLEETGLILEVGKWALARALADHRAWAGRDFPVPRIAVNVSAIQLQRREFADTVIEVLQQQGDNSDALELEITESLLMRDVQASTRKLSILRDLGIRIAMDDFGTGYSSLSYIARLPIDAVKIDRSFINAMAGNSQDMAIVSTIVTLAHSLNLKVVAEGVETEDQAKLLMLLNCDEAQGFLYSKPVPAAEIQRILQVGAGDTHPPRH
jgi:diguanylate cyclase (GGDEF)-like protein